MIRSQIPWLCAVCLTLASALPASAQIGGSTGPGGNPVVGPGGNPGLQQPAGQTLNEQNFPQFLRNMGLNPQEQAVNGKRYYIVQKDGWTFVLHLRTIRNQQTGAIVGYDLVSPLGGPLASPEADPASRLLRLLQANGQIIPCVFSYVEAERQMYLILGWNNQVRQQGFTNEVNFFLRTIQNNRPLWDLTV